MKARFEAKIFSLQQCLEALKSGRLARPLVFTNGVFDILHRGHITYLDTSAQLGASLLVAVNTDKSVRSLAKVRRQRIPRGPEQVFPLEGPEQSFSVRGEAPPRPFNAQEDRAALLAALACVDAVTVFDEVTPEALITVLRPDIIVKGDDYDMEKLPETALVKSWGGKAVAVPFIFQRSTTALVQKIRGGASEFDSPRVEPSDY